MAYISLCGKPPFWGSPFAMLAKMRGEEYPLEGRFWGAASPDARDFVASLLKANPEDRLPGDRLLQHPWLARPFVPVAPEVIVQVLSNMEHFSHAPDFLSICVASMAKQLDHRSLDNVYRVFCRLDRDGDGVLELEEVKAGFVEVYGAASEEVASVDEIFRKLDLDGTGRITYTEFCAAAIGEGSYMQEQVLWSAFKSFDLSDTGRITHQDMTKVLSSTDVNQVWTRSVCENVAQQVDGDIDFADWLSLMRACAVQHSAETPKRRSSLDSEEAYCRSSSGHSAGRSSDLSATSLRESGAAPPLAAKQKSGDSAHSFGC